MSARLLAAAAGHGDVLSTRDAARLGVSVDGLAHLVRRGALVRVRRGAYVVAPAWEAAGPEARLALRVRAVLRARGSGVATHQSALALHRLPLYGASLEVADVTGPVQRVHRLSGVRVHPLDDTLPSGDVEGCGSLDPAAALAQVFLRESRETAVVAADAALHRGLVAADDVGALIARLAPTPRAVVRAGGWLRAADAASESPGESRTRLLLVDLGYRVRSQVRIAEPDGTVVARVDLLVGDRVVVEFDGLVKYAGADGPAALAAEKRREDRLRALGYEVVRLTWADLERPARVAALVREALARAAIRPRSG